ncbi:hypothetical protein BFL36_06505 [Clavibacter michiganensis]|uniref:Uncharacterized protein n=1 Tax=Clavibacter michiganensis TaxID=28447 RepID=A0A251YID1_9MICO|nr:hypothetical protein [Clavibacter michiganensis]OUE24015.1 hypothetical protein BFL36_06505 [Clavibacter michiganensis]
MISSDPADGLMDVVGAADVEIAAAAFDNIGAAMDEAMQSITRSWSGLFATDVFDTPDSARLFDALSPAQALSRTVGEDAAGAKAALLAYSTSLADLAVKRKNVADYLAEDVTSQAATAIPLVPGMIDGFNNEVDQADEECAAALLKLIRYSGDALVGAVQGIGETLELPAVKLAVDVAKDLAKKGPELRDAARALTDAAGLTQTCGEHAAEPIATASEPMAEALSANGDSGGEHVAEGGALGKAFGKGLGVAGILATAGAATAEQYDHDEAEHPDWDQTHRTQHAIAGGVAAGLATGAASAVGSLAGEALGAAVGEMIFPFGGGIAGAMIGEFAGGLAGGFVGDMVGGIAADGFMDTMDHLFG